MVIAMSVPSCATDMSLLLVSRGKDRSVVPFPINKLLLVFASSSSGSPPEPPTINLPCPVSALIFVSATASLASFPSVTAKSRMWLVVTARLESVDASSASSVEVTASAAISVVPTLPVTATVGVAPALSAALVTLPLEKSCPFCTVTVKLIFLNLFYCCLCSR